MPRKENMADANKSRDVPDLASSPSAGLVCDDFPSAKRLVAPGEVGTGEEHGRILSCASAPEDDADLYRLFSDVSGR